MEITKGTVIWFEDAETGEDVQAFVEFSGGDTITVYFPGRGLDTVHREDLTCWRGEFHGGKVF